MDYFQGQCEQKVGVLVSTLSPNKIKKTKIHKFNNYYLN